MIGALEPSAPDGEEARSLAEEELSRPEYTAAEPTPFDLWARDVQDFVERLFDPDVGSGAGQAWLSLLVVLVVAALVVAVVLWGRPRASRRTREHRQLLGAADVRAAAALRTDAERAARRGEWGEAVVFRYRALARGLLERDLIDPAPGATAQAIAREGAVLFPTERESLAAAATVFDAVRYLGLDAREDRYRSLAETDERISALRPAEPHPIPPGASTPHTQGAAI